MARLLFCELSCLLDHAFVFYMLNSQATVANKLMYMAATGAL